MNKYCNEFIAGFCSKTRFNIDGLTENCSLNHSKAEQINFKNTSDVLFGFESPVLSKFNLIIDECDRKIENLKILLKRINYNEKNNLDKNNCSSERQKILNVLNIIDKKIEDKKYMCYELIKLRGELTEKLLYFPNYKESDAIVCEVCGSLFKKDENCKHFFHETYKNLRDIRTELYERIKTLIKK